MKIELPTYAWTPSHNFSSRGGQKVRLIVAHDCEGPGPGSIGWLCNPKSQVSAHGVLSEDGKTFTHLVAWGNKAWHSCNFNPFSEGIEAAGYSAKGLGADEWKALANLVAFRLRANDIPCQRATAENNWTGYCQHVDLGEAGGGHHDISSDPNVRANFDAMIAAAYELEMPINYGYRIPVAPPAAQPGFTPSQTVRHDLPQGSMEWAQSRLNALGMSAMPLSIDGMEGPATRFALIKFQTQMKLTVDGVLGPQTITALEGTGH